MIRRRERKQSQKIQNERWLQNADESVIYFLSVEIKQPTQVRSTTHLT